MYRLVLGVVIGISLSAVCVATAVGLGVVGTNHSNDVKAPDIAPVAAAAAAEPAPAAETAKKARRPKADPVVATTPELAKPAEAAPQTAFDADELVKTLTPEQEQKLGNVLRDRQMKKMMQEMRYRTASSTKIDMLAWKDKSLRLSDTQAAQIKTIREDMRPRMEASLGQYWARQDELNKAVMEIYSSTTSREEAAQQTKPLRDQMKALQEEMAPVQQQLDDEFAVAVKAVLTPEQAKAMDEMPSYGVGGQWGGGVQSGGGAMIPMGGEKGRSPGNP
jgi:gas vesicle protein